MVAISPNSALLPAALAALSLGGLLLVWWSLLLPRVPLILLAASLIIGQAWRLPLPGQGGGLLLSDLAVILILIAASANYVRSKHSRLVRSQWSIVKSLSVPILLFLAWAAITTLLGLMSLRLDLPATLITLSYYLRLATHLLLLRALLLLFRSPRLHKAAAHLFVGATSTLLALGFLQFFFFSNFAALAPAGWDPHRWRLTSTWLDPNFFAAFILIAAPSALAMLIAQPYHSERRPAAEESPTHTEKELGKNLVDKRSASWRTNSYKLSISLGLGLCASLALLATKSRSGLLAGSLALPLLFPLLLSNRSLLRRLRPYVPLLVSLAISCALIGAAILGPRLFSLLSDDPTARLRLNALQSIQQRLLPAHALLGTGYNAYQFAAAKAGLITDFAQHSRAGADNSLLTIWITTGLPGLLLFAAIYLAAARLLLQRWLIHRQSLALTALFGLLALAVHSQFVNSFLYSHLLITLAWLLALVLSSPQRPHAKQLPCHSERRPAAEESPSSIGQSPQQPPVDKLKARSYKLRHELRKQVSLRTTKYAFHTHKILIRTIPALLPAYLIRFSVLNIPTNLLEILILAAAVSGALSPVTRRSWRLLPARLPRPVLICTTLFVLSALISTTSSPHPGTSLGILKGWILIPILYAAMLTASTRSSMVTSHESIVSSLLTGGLVSALYSFSDLGQTDRLKAFYDTPNSLALYLAPLTTLAFSLGLLRPLERASSPPPPHQLPLIPTAAILFLALLFTISMGGILSTTLTAIIGFLVIKKLGFDLKLGIWNLKIGVIAAAALIGLSVWALFPKITYLLQPESSAAVRLQLWSISRDLIQQTPLLGLGLGVFEPAYQQQLHHRFSAYVNCQKSPGTCTQTKPLAEFVYRDPHNWPLAFHLNLGFLGLIAFTTLNFLALKPTLNILKEAPLSFSASGGRGRGVGGEGIDQLSASWRTESYKLSLSLSLATILIHGLVDTIYWKNDLALLWWLLIALLVSTTTALTTRKSTAPS